MGLVFYPVFLSTSIYVLWREFAALWNAWAILIELVRGQLAKRVSVVMLACFSSAGELLSGHTHRSLLVSALCPPRLLSAKAVHLSSAFKKKTNTHL